jgi:hypothetical protein
LHFDVDLVWLNQSPQSPSPRVGTELSPDFDADANVNPLGSHIDLKRPTISAGYDHKTGFGSWAVTASYAYSNQDVLRGFLVADPVFPETDAHGFRQTIGRLSVQTDLNLTSVPRWRSLRDRHALRARSHGGDFVAPDDAPRTAGVGRQHPDHPGSGDYGYAAWHRRRWRSRDAFAIEFGPARPRAGATGARRRGVREASAPRSRRGSATTTM